MNNDVPNNTCRRGIKILLLVIFAGGFVAFYAVGGADWLSLDAVRLHRNELLAYTEQHYATVLLVGMLIYVASTALSVPGATVLSLVAGFLFGRWVGAAAIIVSATLGATLVFLAARYLFAEAAQRRVGGAAKKLIAGFNENVFNYLLFLRLVPLFPFWLVNLVPAFTPIKTRTYITATALGILPGSFVFAHLGQSLGRIESVQQLVSWEIGSAFVLLGIFALIPVLVKKWRTRTATDTRVSSPD
ncbi:MAG: TVP38/TMEM64 family protein [Proteobacteria bacterium]|nr:TVP38/TMEM64 family protein [Pseudomonadota bacterium]